MQTLELREEAIFSPLLRRYTLEEFWALPDPHNASHYELIGGYLFMVPPPEPPHDDIDARLNKSLMRFLISNDLKGDVHHPQAAIYKEASGGTYLEPDMMYVSAELRERMERKRTSADIVFEYSSRSTAVYDRTTKADTYLALGVRELWLVDSDAVTIEVRYATTHKGRPAWEAWIFSPGDVAQSRVLPGWKVSVDELFQGLV
ncbi:MAG TPA: Uma2 family endonuclease [Pyrinomonadaceae bacterium]|nr:Uma2 family endonuclease [Pyrinomonadaceae bacterium]